MNTQDLMHKVTWISRQRLRRALGALLLVGLIGSVAGCSGGAPTTQNPVSTPAAAASYSGPPPATADVQAFMVNLWANVKATNRCGGCHVAGGQSPQFARTDDVNLAYQAAQTVVNLPQPSQSEMVQKVSGGHNCWLASPSACGDTLAVWIGNWAGSSATGTQSIKLTAPVSQTVGASKSFPPDPTLFESTVYPLLTQYCSRCHSPAPSPRSSRISRAPIRSRRTRTRRRKLILAIRRSRVSWCDWAPSFTIAGTCAPTTRRPCWRRFSLREPDPSDAGGPEPGDLQGLSLYDGTVASGQSRYTTSQIALYEFKTGSGTIAYDTSGVEPELDLNLSGNYTWDQSWGVVFNSGSKAQGTTTSSAKLYNMISQTGEFTIEAGSRRQMWRRRLRTW